MLGWTQSRRVESTCSVCVSCRFHHVLARPTQQISVVTISIHGRDQWDQRDQPIVFVTVHVTLGWNQIKSGLTHCRLRVER